LRATPTSTQALKLLTVAGKVVGEDTPDVAYSAYDRYVREGAGERVNPAPAVTDLGLGVIITPRRKAPLRKATADVDIKVPVPLPVPVPAPVVVTPETS